MTDLQMNQKTENRRQRLDGCTTHAVQKAEVQG